MLENVLEFDRDTMYETYRHREEHISNAAICRLMSRVRRASSQPWNKTHHSPVKVLSNGTWVWHVLDSGLSWSVETFFFHTMGDDIHRSIYLNLPTYNHCKWTKNEYSSSSSSTSTIINHHLPLLTIINHYSCVTNYQVGFWWTKNAFLWSFHLKNSRWTSSPRTWSNLWKKSLKMWDPTLYHVNMIYLHI